MVRVEFFAGAAMLPHLPALGRLRIVVFREWPYLYDGSLENEQNYLAGFAACPRVGLAVAFDGENPVGCSSCLPLADEDDAVRAPFLARALDPARFFYFGESVLLPAFRGQGIGVEFFRAREAHARATSNCDFATFCAVQRAQNHPLRPAGAVPLDAFWRKRGFLPYPDLVCAMRWKQVDSEERVENRLAFWLKSLTGAPLP
jgi:GNAT superfamily N-acetyltransferase